MKHKKLFILCILCILIFGLIGVSYYYIHDLKTIKQQINENIINLELLYNEDIPMDEYIEFLTQYEETGDENIIISAEYIEIENKILENGNKIYELNTQNDLLIKEFNEKVEKFPYNIFVLFIN